MIGKIIQALKGRYNKRYDLAQSLSKVLLHIVFSTKNRQRWINRDLQPKLHAYLAGACRKLGGHAYCIGGTEDHVHIACSLPRTLSISKLLEEIKKSSSAWIKKQDPGCHDFAWQAGYGAFSLGESQLEALLRYIHNQPEHHRKRSFKEEFIDFLDKYRIEYDTRYLWD